MTGFAPHADVSISQPLMGIDNPDSSGVSSIVFHSQPLMGIDNSAAGWCLLKGVGLTTPHGDR